MNRRPVSVGEMLSETMEQYFMDVPDLASRLQISSEELLLYVLNRESVTEEVAIRLSQVFPFPPSYWLRLDTAYRQWQENNDVI